MANFSKTDTRRITFLSLLGSSATVGAQNGESPGGVYDDAKHWLTQMERDGFFDEEVGSGNERSSGRSGGSGQRGSSSRSGSRGRDRARQSNGGGQGMRDPDGPPTDKQVAALLKHSNDYTEDEAWELTKQEVSDILDDLFAD